MVSVTQRNSHTLYLTAVENRLSFCYYICVSSRVKSYVTCVISPCDATPTHNRDVLFYQLILMRIKNDVHSAIAVTIYDNMMQIIGPIASYTR